MEARHIQMISLGGVIGTGLFLSSGYTINQAGPVVPWFAFLASLASCLLIWFDPSQRVALYWTVPFVALCYGGYYLARFLKRRGALPASPKNRH
ncbi:hypothetical protein HCZ88_01995 [Limosilactobacillus fermentum]